MAGKVEGRENAQKIRPIACLRQLPQAIQRIDIRGLSARDRGNGTRERGS